MPIKIPEYGEQRVDLQVAKTPRANYQPAGAAPGAGLGEGISALAKAGEAIVDDISTTEAEEALTKFEREKNALFHNPDGGYFNTQGKDAYDMQGRVTESLTKLKKNYSESLSAGARDKFNRVAEKHVTQGMSNIQQHAFKGFKAWEVATIKAGVENSIENIALDWGNKENVALQFELGRAAIRDAAKLEGISGEALNEQLQNFDASAAQAAIKAATAESAEKGMEALDLYGERLEGADKAIIKDGIETKSRQEKQRDDAIAAVSITNNVLTRYKSLSEMQDAVREKTKNDPELMGKALRELQSQFANKRSADADARVQNFELAEDFIYKGGTAAQFMATNEAAWDSLTVTQRRSIESGKPVTTNWNKYNEFMLMDPVELAKVDPNKYVPHLAKEERNKFYTAYKAARKGEKSSEHQVGRTIAAQTKSTVEQILGKKSKDWSTEKQATADKVYKLIDDEARARKVQLKRDLTSDEYTDLLNGFTRKVARDKSILGISYKSEVRLKDAVLDLPQDEIDILTNTLRANNLPVTNKNLINLYEQVRD